MMMFSKLRDKFRSRKNKKSKNQTPLNKVQSNQDGVYYIQLEDNTTGSHRADYYVQLSVGSDLNVRFRVYTSGNGGIIFGNNQRAKISEDGLTAARSYTLPDYDTQLAGSTLNIMTIGPSSQSTPSNPAIDYSKVYVKPVDANNDGVFVLIKKNGDFVEVQLL